MGSTLLSTLAAGLASGFGSGLSDRGNSRLIGVTTGEGRSAEGGAGRGSGEVARGGAGVMGPGVVVPPVGLGAGPGTGAITAVVFGGIVVLGLW